MHDESRTCGNDSHHNIHDPVAEANYTSKTTMFHEHFLNTEKSAERTSDRAFLLLLSNTHFFMYSLCPMQMFQESLSKETDDLMLVHLLNVCFTHVTHDMCHIHNRSLIQLSFN